MSADRRRGRGTDGPDTPAGPGAARTLDSRPVYEGKIVRLRLDTVRYPDGSTGELEIVSHVGAAAALPLTTPGVDCDAGTPPRVILLRQYRHAVGDPIWEVPAGKLDGEESPEACARRELREETGVAADRLERLATLWTTPGFTNERIHLFLATGLTFGATQREGHELMETHEVRLAEALDMIERGEIDDAKTVACLLMAARRLD